MNIEKGDTIGIIALSGDCEREKIEKAVSNIEKLGYKVKLSGNIFEKNRYLAGLDDDKIEELEKFFLDKDIKLILTARGGYGAIRLINKIDYEIIKNNPKPFCGFSDVTALLLMIYKRTGIITYHSPMALSDFGCDEISDFTIKNFISTLTNSQQIFEGSKVYQNGLAEGILWGGNLSTLVSLCGQDFVPEESFIFFTEDLNELVYKIDKMFQQLLNIETFSKNCKGIILGDFLDVDNEKWLEEYFFELAKRMNIPVAGGFKITHLKDKITLPIGIKASLNGIKLSLD